MLLNSIFVYQIKAIPQDFWSIFRYQLMMLPLLFVANLILAQNFLKAYKNLGSMTFVLASSNLFDIVSLIIVSYVFLSETPSLKTLIGLSLVVTGLILAKL